jgi:biotin carboxyl carrier protein
MKRYVNGERVELDPTGAAIAREGERILVNGHESAAIVERGSVTLVSFRGAQYKIERRRSGQRSTTAGSGDLRAMMPGQITDVRVTAGSAVTKGQTVLVLEAMKTQQPFQAPFDGIVTSVDVSTGDQVVDGQRLALVEETK